MKVRAAGFTLIELMIGVAIIGILVALGGVVGRRMIENAQAATCSSNLRALGVGLQSYLADHGNTMPPLAAARASVSENVPVIDNTLNAYVDDVRVFRCPGDRLMAGATGTSYYWNSTLSGQSVANLSFLGLFKELSRNPVMSDKEGWHKHAADDVQILYADGGSARGVKFITEGAR